MNEFDMPFTTFASVLYRKYNTAAHLANSTDKLEIHSWRIPSPIFGQINITSQRVSYGGTQFTSGV